MAPHRRSRNSAVLSVRWQHRTVAILCDTVQSVIQQAADHFHLSAIVDELVLVGRIDGAGEELELTTDTLYLLSEDATVTLTRVSRYKLPRGVASTAQAKARKVTIHIAAVLQHNLYTMSVYVRPTCKARKVLRTIARKLQIQETDLGQALDDIHPDISLRDNGIRDGDVINVMFD
ncbi:hypothetical protein V8D89_007142 [Ganoderma adspersum]